MQLYFLLNRLFLNPSTSISLCHSSSHSSRVNHGCEAVNVTDAQRKLNGIMNSELRQSGRQNKGKEDCNGEKRNQCNYCCPFATRTASLAQTVRPLCLSAFTPFSAQGVEEQMFK